MAQGSIRRRLQVTFMGLVAVSVLLTGAVQGWRNYQDHVNAAHARQQELARRVAVEVQSVLQNFEVQLKNTIRISDFARQTLPEKQRILSRLLAERDHFREIRYVDAQGNEALHLSNVRLLDNSHTEWRGEESEFRVAAQTGLPYLGPLYYSPSDNEPLMLFGMPVRDIDRDQFNGVLMTELRFKAVWQMIGNLELATGEDVYLIDQDGFVIAHRNPSIVLQQSRLQLTSANWRQNGLQGNMAFLAAQPFTFGQKSFWVVAERDAALALAPAVADVKLTAMVLVLVLAAAFGLLIPLSHRITRPVIAVANAARAIRGGDLEQRVPVERQDEIGELAQNFNQMTEQLNASLHALQTEVAERTQAQAALERLNKAYQALSSTSQAVATAANESQLLDAICRIVREDCGYLLVWIGLAEHDPEKTVRPVAQAGYEDGYLAEVRITWADSERGWGPSGTAIRERRAVVVRDIHNDPSFALWREQALQRGYASSAAFPIQSGDTIYGALMVYASAPDAFSSDESQLLRKMAENIASGIAKLRSEAERLKAEAALEQYRLHLEALVEERTAALTEAKELAEAASHAKTTFLSNMSHELRTPMNAIMGMTGLAMQRATDPKLLDQLGKIDKASRHLLAVINDILDISKIEAGRLHLDAVDFLLGEVLENLQRMVGIKVAEKGLHLRLDMPAELSRQLLHGDPLRLGQILINLTGNALKFTDAGAITVVIRLVEESPTSVLLRFAVQDTGIGIAATDQGRLFTAFEQADGSLTRKYGGTGLGLAICKRLVLLMDGEIGVESTIGQGSTFWFTARLAKARAGNAAVSPAPTFSASSFEAQLRTKHAGARILLVEDEPVNQEVSQGLLESLGLAVDLAEDGVQAVALAGDNVYDLILMDMQMPNLNGLDATRAIRALPGHAHTPILAMTANAFDEDRQVCFDAGMNDHIGKPVDPTVLFVTLLKWLAQPRS